MASKGPVDVSKLTEEQRDFYEKYGRLPPPKKDILGNKLKGDRKYFDSGDYALSKAGNATQVGTQHPSPERIPHSIPQNLKKDAHAITNSPVKESSLVHEVAEKAAQK